MGVTDDLEMARLLATRICHDLAGPLGAVVNGSELLADDPSFAAEAAGLIGNSATAATARLKLYRAAFGRATNMPGFAEASGLLAGYLRAASSAATVPEVQWLGPQEDITALKGDALQLLVNLCLLAADCLPRGGTIRAGFRGHGDEAVLVAEASGIGANTREGVDSAVLLTADSLNPKTVQAYFTARLAAGLGLSLTLRTELDLVVITARVADG